MSFKVGAKVEVVGKGIVRNSFYEATDQNVKGRKATVRYHSLNEEAGEGIVEEVRLRSLRPDPGVVVVKLKVRDLVDVHRAGGWWKGLIIAENEHNYHVHFDNILGEPQHGDFHKSNARIHRVWNNADPRGYWVIYKAE